MHQRVLHAVDHLVFPQLDGKGRVLVQHHRGFENVIHRLSGQVGPVHRQVDLPAVRVQKIHAGAHPDVDAVVNLILQPREIFIAQKQLFLEIRPVLIDAQRHKHVPVGPGVDHLRSAALHHHVRKHPQDIVPLGVTDGAVDVFETLNVAGHQHPPGHALIQRLLRQLLEHVVGKQAGQRIHIAVILRPAVCVVQRFQGLGLRGD